MEYRHCEQDCIFCVSKCPECGATDIEYRLAIMFSCGNDEKNEIEISAYIDPEKSEATCNECDYMFTGDEMEKIGLTLMRTYEISPMKVFSHNIDGTISKEGFRVEWRDG